MMKTQTTTALVARDTDAVPRGRQHGTGRVLCAAFVLSAVCMSHAAAYAAEVVTANATAQTQTSATSRGPAVFYPRPGIVCDRVSHFCADRQGISQGLTAQYLGKSAQAALQRSLGDGKDVHLDLYTLSNGVHCESAERTCYRNRFKSRVDKTATEKLFGRGSAAHDAHP